MRKYIEPTVLKGTRDLLPEDMVWRNKTMITIIKTFKQFGYQQIETPILSKAETILGKTGGQSDEKLAYTFKDYGGREVALPFDLTMPFARFVAANNHNLAMPFKRFQAQPVWRAERPQRGRLREFYQCDADIIGSNEIVCEAEITKLVYSVFERLKLNKIVIRVNSRKLLNEILKSLGVAENQLTKAIRLIDKLEKIGEEKVVSELEKINIKNAKDILKLLKPAGDNQATLDKLKEFNTAELEEYLEKCKLLKVPDGLIKFDPSLARGLDYYTGMTFEVVYPGSNLGTICAGGRYDDLAGLFSRDEFSGVGVSFGFERIMILLEELGLAKDGISGVYSLVTVFDKNSLKDSIEIYNTLLSERLSTELYLGSGNLSKQFKFADKKKIPFVIVRGPDEKEKGEVLIRRMSNGIEKRLPANQLVSYIKGFYEAV
ncbi:MAG: histidine--tRNA ligase [Candidatus Saccharimonadales bacterium]